MINVSEHALAYISVQYPPIVQSSIMTSLQVLEEFSVPNFEDELDSVISMEGYAEADDIRILFLEKLNRLLNVIISEHRISLFEEAEISFTERLEICQFLQLVQNLEDTSFLGYKVYSEDTPRNIFVTLLSRYSYLTQSRAMEIIKDVNQDLIDAMRKMVLEDEDSVTCDKKQLLEWKIFTAYTKDSDNLTTLGHVLSEKGYKHIEMEYLLSLENRIIQERITSTKDKALLAIDLISLLLMCKDTYQIPLLEYDKRVTEFITDFDIISGVRDIISRMLKDYSVYKEGYLQILTEQETSRG